MSDQPEVMRADNVRNAKDIANYYRRLAEHGIDLHDHARRAAHGLTIPLRMRNPIPRSKALVVVEVKS